MILPQQVLFLSVPYYADDAGTKQIFKNVAATKERPFLVIWSDDEIVLSVNITSEKFENSRQIFDKNLYLIGKYNPPLSKPSLAILNCIYVFDYFKELDKKLMKDGAKLNESEFQNILDRIEQVTAIPFTKEELFKCNSF